MLTSELPEPSLVLESASTTPKPRVFLSSNAPIEPKSKQDFEVVKEMFFMGLEILGEKKKIRFLLYLASLQQNQEKKANEF